MQKIKIVVLEAVKHDELSLEFIHDLLKEHIDAVLLAVRQNGDALTFAHGSLKQINW